jgi:hypothetical protein
MSQTISRPTSKTRKPTMKIHPSVVTTSMLARSGGPGKSYRAYWAGASLVTFGSGT